MFADATTGSVAVDRSRALVRALDLRLALTEKDYAVVSTSSTTEKTAAPHEHFPTVEEILGIIAARLHGNSQIRELARSARAWKILKNGALAKAIGVQDAKVTDLAQGIRDAFFDRFRDGRQILAADPMKDLIRVISDNTQLYLGTEEHRNEVGVPDEAPESLIRPSATIEKIAELERILGVKLPEDYKEFLSLSDGLGSSWGGIIMQPPLHPTSDVRWEDDEDYFTDLRLEILPFEVSSICREFPGLAEADDWPRVGRTIQIGQRDIDVVWLLLPATVAKVRDAYLHIVDSKEAPEGLKTIVMNAVNSFAGSRQDFEKLDWCVLHWTSGGGALMIAYRSFKEFMADKARKSGTDYWAGEEWEKVCFAYGCC
jgi:SMI1 / KNR4 family (SUKH-1)